MHGDEDSQAEEQEWIARAVRRDVDAYGALVRRYQSSVFAVCVRLLGDQLDAEDATQESFLRAFQRLHTFDATRRFGPWIRRVAANLCFNRLEGKPPAHVPFDEQHAQSTVAGDPMRHALDLERQQLLASTLLRLPPSYRIVVELRHFQEMSYEAIANELHLPLSTVKTHLFRARKELAELLRVQGGENV